MTTFGSNTSQSSTPNYNTSTSKINNLVRDGDQFVLLTKSQGDTSYRIWSSSDQRQTEEMLKTVSKQLVGVTT